MERPILVVGAFDDLRYRDLRLLDEASKLGPVTVLLLTDDAIQATTNSRPKFPWPERLYLLQAVRFVSQVLPLNASESRQILSAAVETQPRLWLDWQGPENGQRRELAVQSGLEYCVVPSSQLAGYPEPLVSAVHSYRKKVIVTGCYDWLHSGHVRFFEEVSAYGDLYVIVGHDANIRLLKGEGHPLLPQEERRYMAGAIRHVTQALVSTGDGWLDAEPEIRMLKPDIYAVNEDGDRGGKREYCSRAGLEYLVLKRVPAPGLPPRSSTDLRGF
jgi:cytidyltransferase-like protein